MALDPLEHLDLSDLPDYDADQEYRALLRALRRQEGFGLIFVRCSPEQGNQLIATLPQDLPRKRYEVLTLLEPLPEGDFLGRAAEFLAQSSADIVFVQGLEHSLLDYEETKRQSGWSKAESQNYSWKGVPPILRNLNQQRDRFRNELPVCFVFLVPLFVMKYLRRRAPDFFDWRSGVFEFQDAQDFITQKIQECFLEDYEKVQGMTPSERIRQAVRIRDLLEDPSINPDERFRLLIDLGVIQASSETFEDAQISCNKALDTHVSTADNLVLKGQLLASLSRDEEAISNYDKALAIKPDDHDTWYNRGNSLDELGRYEEAIASYDHALKVKPDKHEAWTNRGISLRKLGRYDEAIASYDHALKVKPDYHTAWYNRGFALDELGRYEEAITSYDHALKVKPDYHTAWNNRGIALHNLGRYEEAIASYDHALKVKPDKHDAWNNRGISLRKLGRYDEAITSYDHALKVKPDDHTAWYNKACCYSLQGKAELALENLKQAIQLSPDENRELAKTDSEFDPIRNDPRFQALVENAK